MRRDARFWRNVALIALVHARGFDRALALGWPSKIESAQEITWLSADEDTSASIDSPKPEETPTTGRSPLCRKKINPCLRRRKARSNFRPLLLIQLRPRARPRNRRQKLRPNPVRRKRRHRNRVPRRRKRNQASNDIRKREGKQPKSQRLKKTNALQIRKEIERNNCKKWKAPLAAGRRRTPVPIQPTPVGTATCCTIAFIANGSSRLPWSPAEQSFRHLAKIRIEKDGRISDFKIVRPSGNVVVDESVQVVGKKVTRVDALPTGIGNGGHYDVNINFALNSK